jgi:hypothetical protein
VCVECTINMCLCSKMHIVCYLIFVEVLPHTYSGCAAGDRLLY